MSPTAGRLFEVWLEKIRVWDHSNEVIGQVWGTRSHWIPGELSSLQEPSVGEVGRDLGLGGGQEDVIGLCWPWLSDEMIASRGSSSRGSSSSYEGGVRVGRGAGGDRGGRGDHDSPPTMVTSRKQGTRAYSGVGSRSD